MEWRTDANLVDPANVTVMATCAIKLQAKGKFGVQQEIYFQFILILFFYFYEPSHF